MSENETDDRGALSRFDSACRTHSAALSYSIHQFARSRATRTAAWPHLPRLHDSRYRPADCARKTTSNV